MRVRQHVPNLKRLESFESASGTVYVMFNLPDRLDIYAIAYKTAYFVQFGNDVWGSRLFVATTPRQLRIDKLLMGSVRFVWQICFMTSISLHACILTRWGRVTYICGSTLTIIDADNCRRQDIIWTNVGILLIWPLGTNFSGILIGIHIFSFQKVYLKMSSEKWRPFWLCLNVMS